MRLAGQNWNENEKYLIIALHEPYWGAYKKFGWENGVEGYSISSKALAYSALKEKKILIKANKYGNYTISPSKVLENARITYGRNRTVLYCIPRTALEKVKGGEIE